MKDVRVVIVSMNPPESLTIKNLTDLYYEFSSNPLQAESKEGTLPHFLWNLLSKVSTEERKKFANWFNNNKGTSKVYWTHLVKSPVEEYMKDNGIKIDPKKSDKIVSETFKKVAIDIFLKKLETSDLN